jgi:putative PIN family toxin of toxin-antitoxin system
MITAVLDTNVLVAALKSKTGASHQILRLAARKEFQPVISNSLLLEYMEVLHRPGLLPGFTTHRIDEILEAFCFLSRQTKISFQWRPLLRDQDDHMVLECALSGSADYLVTHNIRDFAQARFFEIGVVTPVEFVNIFEP